MIRSILFVASLSTALQASSAVPNRNLDDSSVDFKQVGQDLFGAAANAEFGSTVQLSSLDGSRLLVGSPLHGWRASAESSAMDNNMEGGIFLYDYDGFTWNLLWFLHGNKGEEIGDRASISADGTRLAVRRYNNTLSKNCAEVYDIDQTGIATLVGSPIIGTANGKTVTLSPNGQRLALSSESFKNSRGRVEVFDWNWNENAWSRTGSFTGFENNDRLGFVTSFSSSGDRLAMSAPNYGGGEIARRGLVRVFDYDPVSQSWSKIGMNINGRSEKDYLGFSIALSYDGSTLVVGSPGSAGSGVLRGKIRVYRLFDDNWVPQGGGIEGLMDNDRFGRSVAISASGSTIAASSYFHDDQRGHIRIFNVHNGIWAQVGSGIYGSIRQDRLGFGILSLTMTADGNRFAAGAVFADKPDGTLNAGQVRVFDQATVYPDTLPPSQSSLRPSSRPSQSTFVPSAGPSPAPSAIPSTGPSTVPSAGRSSAPSSLSSVTPQNVSANSSTSPSEMPVTIPTPSPTPSPSQPPTNSHLADKPQSSIPGTEYPTRSPTPAPTVIKMESSVPTDIYEPNVPGLDSVSSEPNTPMETSSAFRMPVVSMFLLVIPGIIAVIGMLTNTSG